MYGSDWGNKVGLFGACIKSDSCYINKYEFGPYGVQSWSRIIKMLISFSYKDQQNILIKLKRKFVHYCPYYLEEYLTTKNKFSNHARKLKGLLDLNPRLERII